MHVIATYDGPSFVKLNERAISYMLAQEDTYEDDTMHIFPDIKAGDWVGVSGNWGETHYGIVKYIEWDDRVGWENAAELYYIHLLYDNQDITCWPIELVSHCPTACIDEINKEIVQNYKQKRERLCKDMLDITNRFITSITNTVIEWQ